MNLMASLLRWSVFSTLLPVLLEARKVGSWQDGQLPAFMKKELASGKPVKLNGDIPLGSSLGQKILAQSHRSSSSSFSSSSSSSSSSSTSRELENYYDISFLPSYSLKVNGCSQVTTWNMEAGGNEDMKLRTKRLLKYRLCPTSSCSDYSDMGCDGSEGGSYGDYVIDLDIFLASYIEYLEEKQGEICSQYAVDTCNCGDDDAKNANFDQEQCEFQCWYKYGYDECYIDYTVDDYANANQFFLENYLMCAAYQPPGYNGGRRHLEEGGDDADGGGDDTYFSPDRYYYIGPYCSSSSSDVYLGMFLDDTCSRFADENYGKDAYAYFTGKDLPYSDLDLPLVTKDCIDCYAADDDAANYNVRFVCEGTYMNSGKCETNMDIRRPNVAACTYVRGIDYVEQYSQKTRHKFDLYGTMFGFYASNSQPILIVFGSIFGVMLIYVLVMRSMIYKRLQEHEKSKEIAFNLAQVEDHYTDVKVKDAFLAM